MVDLDRKIFIINSQGELEHVSIKDALYRNDIIEWYVKCPHTHSKP